MSSPKVIFWAGIDGTPDDARPLIDAFLDGGVDVGLLVGDDGAASYDPETPLGGVRRGWLARSDAELRWRREGDRTLVTLVSEQTVPGLPTEHEEVGSITLGPTTILPALNTGPEPVGVRRIVYLGPDGTFLATRDEPRISSQEG